MSACGSRSEGHRPLFTLRWPRALVGAGASLLLGVLVGPTPAAAADLTVPGLILDQNGEPIQNTSVFIRNVTLNSDQIVTTDSSGAFSFAAPPQTQVDIRVDAFDPMAPSDQFMDRITINRQTHADFIEGFTTVLVPTIIGTEGDDTITGTSGDDVILGLGGDDTIDGGAGKDVIIGGAGNDILSGEDGKDILSGGDDQDTLYGGGNDDYLWGGNNSDKLFGQSGDDTLVDIDFGDGTNRLFGGGGADKLTIYWSGNLGSPTSHQVISGGGGNDYILDSAPDVTIRSGAGDDLIVFDTLTSATFTIDCGDGSDVVNPNFHPQDLSLFTDCETITVVA